MKSTKILILILIVFAAAGSMIGCEKREAEFKTNITDGQVLDNVLARLANKNVSVVGANVVYDVDNKTWNSKVALIVKNNQGNHGNFKNGYDFSYQAVLVDYMDNGKEDLWILVNVNTGEVVEVYQEKKTGDTALIYLNEEL